MVLKSADVDFVKTDLHLMNSLFQKKENTQSGITWVVRKR